MCTLTVNNGEKVNEDGDNPRHLFGSCPQVWRTCARESPKAAAFSVPCLDMPGSPRSLGNFVCPISALLVPKTKPSPAERGGVPCLHMNSTTVFHEVFSDWPRGSVVLCGPCPAACDAARSQPTRYMLDAMLT